MVKVDQIVTLVLLDLFVRLQIDFLGPDILGLGKLLLSVSVVKGDHVQLVTHWVLLRRKQWSKLRVGKRRLLVSRALGLHVLTR